MFKSKTTLLFLVFFIAISIQILKRPTYKTNVNKQSAELSNVFSGVARKVEFCSLQQTSAYSAGRAILKVGAILKDIKFLVKYTIRIDRVWIFYPVKYHCEFDRTSIMFVRISRHAWHVLRRWCGWWFVSPVKNRWKKRYF